MIFLKEICLFLASFFVSLWGILLLSRIFYRLKFLDNPKKYGLKRKPIPYSMGVIFFLVFFIFSFFCIDFNSKLLLIWIFWAIITVLSFFDDFYDLSPQIRLFFQILIGATIALTSIKIGYISNIFWGVIDLSTHAITFWSYKIHYIPVLFTIFWYVLIFNALNWSDGIPGLTSGLSFVTFLIIFFLWLKLYLTDNYEGGIKNAEFVMQMALILLGSLAIFWFFDVKQKILLGDSGTMFLGFMMATLAIVAGWKIATVVVVFGIYLIDAFYVILRRLWHKKNPLKKDLTHLHHRLEKAGLTHGQIRILLYSLSFIFGLSALFLDKIGKIFVFILLLFIVIFINFIIEKIKLKK